MYKQAIVYKTFIQTVFGSLVYGSPHTMTNQDNKQCDSLCLDSHQQLCIGDRVTFQVYGNICNGIVIDYDSSQEKHLIYYLSGNFEWHNFSKIPFWKRGQPKFDDDAHTCTRGTTAYAQVYGMLVS